MEEKEKHPINELNEFLQKQGKPTNTIDLVYAGLTISDGTTLAGIGDSIITLN